MSGGSTVGAQLSRAQLSCHRNSYYKCSSSVNINWNCSIKSAHELDDGQILVDLADGTQQQCHLLIVANGSNSVIQKALRPEYELHFAGAISIAARTHALDKLPSPLDKTYGEVQLVVMDIFFLLHLLIEQVHFGVLVIYLQILENLNLLEQLMMKKLIRF